MIQEMMQEAQELLKKALALPEEERADLASTLIVIWTTPSTKMRKPPGKKRLLTASKKFDPEKRKQPPGRTFGRRGVLCSTAPRG